MLIGEVQLLLQSAIRKLICLMTWMKKKTEHKPDKKKHTHQSMGWKKGRWGQALDKFPIGQQAHLHINSPVASDNYSGLPIRKGFSKL